MKEHYLSVDKVRIEDEAKRVHREIWDHQISLWNGNPPPPEQMCEPEIAAKILGVKYVTYEDLGRSGCYEVAGILDRSEPEIALSAKFRPQVRRFTGAHEIGHLLLHPGEVLHRDRPIEGLTSERIFVPLIEREENQFAACFLMPRKLVRKWLERIFRRQLPIIFDDELAFFLDNFEPERLLRPEVGSLDRGLAIATARSFGGLHFKSLSELFNVSPSSMAIRLQELGLVSTY